MSKTHLVSVLPFLNALARYKTLKKVLYKGQESISKHTLHQEKKHYLSLGFGTNFYFYHLRILIIIFGLLSLIMCVPLVYNWRQGQKGSIFFRSTLGTGSIYIYIYIYICRTLFNAMLKSQGDV